MVSTIAKNARTANILNRILDQAGLPEILKNLDAGLLTQLIRHVGLEDSGPIVSLISAKQLRAVFDEDLWQSKAPGGVEFFNSSRFGKWLEIMMENGPAFTACKILEIDEDLLLLGICRLVRVVSIHSMNTYSGDDWQSDHGEYPGSARDESLNQTFSDYCVISKDDSSWESILGLLLHLNEAENETLNRLLMRCSNISETCNGDHGGLLKALSGVEMLEEDVIAERDNRRESQGFVTPSSAAVFLDQSRSASLKHIVSEKSMPAIVRFYMKSAEEKNTYEKRCRTPGSEVPAPTRKETAAFIDVLQKAEIIPTASQQKLWYDGPDFGDIQFPLIKAMRVIQELNPDLYTKRIIELSYLSNTLISGCEYRGRKFRPKEAAEAALSVCNLGSEYLFKVDNSLKMTRPIAESIPLLLKTTQLVYLFRIGWKILYNSVILFTAKSILAFLKHLKKDAYDPEQKQEIAGMILLLDAAISSGRPWIFLEELDYLQVFLDGETTAILGELIQEFPTFSKVICRKRGLHLTPFIWSHTHIRALRFFFNDLFTE